ncbi:dTDP-4-dehydrorhamnose reductase [Alphaproteobacteria bacterium]|nr:dTDP-4-dehydrorhamnose reductase [Alphaproteobacteria bacterium]
MNADDLTLLVTGANGQVGQELRRRGPGRAQNVVALDRAGLDIGDADAVAAAVAKIRPSVIINAAAYTAVDQAESAAAEADRGNRIGPANLAAAAAAQNAALIHISTDYVFDGRGKRPYRADDPVAPLGIYGQSKEAGERAVRDALARHVILRTAWVYAAHGSNFMRTMLRVGHTRDELKVVDDQHGTPTPAADIAEACLSIAGHLAGSDGEKFAGTYHYVAEGETTWAGFAEAIFERAAVVWGRRPSVTRITSAEYPVPAPRPAYSVLDCAPTLATFKTPRQPWQAGLEAELSAFFATLENNKG